MPVSRSLMPLPAGQFGFEQARHLLNRAGFGGSHDQIAALADMGLNQAVDLLVDYDDIDADFLTSPAVDPDIIEPLTAERRQARRDGDRNALDLLMADQLRRRRDDRQQIASLARWWMGRMIATPRPLEEKLVLLWHGHFATSYRTVRDSYLMFKQNMFFRKHARGSFAKLAGGIVRDPAMIRFLDNHNNRKRQPNENLARELMELFTLGEGNYTEQDIKQGAAALTGYAYRNNEFEFRRRQHDDGFKTILGKKGAFDGDDFVRIILEQKNCATFICYKLYRFFVDDLDQGAGTAAKAVILRMAGELRARDYRIAPVLKKLFKSRHFYDLQIMTNKIKSPVQLIVGTVRMLGTPPRDASLLIDAAGQMGQELFAPPSVAGWPAGRTWINTSTLFVRQNLATYLLTGKLPYQDHWDRASIGYDPMSLVQNLSRQTPEAVVDHLLPTVLGSNVAPQRCDQLVAFLKERGSEITTDRLIGLLLLMTSTPEYQLC